MNFMQAMLGITYDNIASGQIGVQMLLFQNPQARAVMFHITLAPGAHGGGGGFGGAHTGGTPQGPLPIAPP
jgi:hypothetical protein